MNDAIHCSDMLMFGQAPNRHETNRLKVDVSLIKAFYTANATILLFYQKVSEVYDILLHKRITNAIQMGSFLFCLKSNSGKCCIASFIGTFFSIIHALFARRKILYILIFNMTWSLQYTDFWIFFLYENGFLESALLSVLWSHK